MSNKQIVWMVRAGEGAFLAEEFLSKSRVSIGWKLLGDLDKIKDIHELRERYKQVYPDSKPGKVILCSGQIFRFKSEFKIGDYVVTYNAQERQYSLGTIESDYEYHKEDELQPHWRKVKWLKKIDRDGLSATAKNSLGSIMTIFLIDKSILDELDGKTTTPAEVKEITVQEKETLDTIKEEIEEKAHEFIKDKIQELNWEELQDLVAGILRGMGYKTLVSQRGPDRGKDIVASPDGLGLEDPKIKVEVKHRGQAMGAPELRSFIGGLRPGEKGLYVSTGGFTREGQYEAERANMPVTLIDSDMLVTLVVQNYDQFDADARALLPLRKIYWPV
ncbi:MAG: restriction endonuclease [Cyclobacteriaceae bacterium]|nr:restriction endonuclease [Cyclobacteriaceae bacterium]